MRGALKSLIAATGLTILVSCGANQPGGGNSGTATSPLAQAQAPSKSIGTLHGTVDSGGGRAIVCKDPSGKVLEVRQLDLYEADHTEQLTPAPAQGTIDDEWRYFAKRASTRLIGVDGYQVSMAAMLDLKAQFMKQARFVTEKEATLIQIDDSHEVFKAPGCDIVQLANWQDDDQVLVQKDLWDQMSPRDQAGLIAHEFIYDAYRKMGFRSSVYPRRLVGLLFSTTPLTSLRSGAHKAKPKSTTYECTKRADPDNAFDIDPRITLSFESLHEAKLKFESFPNQILVEKLQTTLDIPEIATAALKCARDEKESKAVERTLNARLQTSYFKDDASLHFEVRCGDKREATLEGPELTLKMTSQHGGRESLYRCQRAANTPVVRKQAAKN